MEASFKECHLFLTENRSLSRWEETIVSAIRTLDVGQDLIHSGTSREVTSPGIGWFPTLKEKLR